VDARLANLWNKVGGRGVPVLLIKIINQPEEDYPPPPPLEVRV